ncbi:hypothetical protein [Crateriforma conspicua]|uniref:hypothetical protein n=1 Tax=Crateriforma conspicua TaxID=2527996 RepID=UPI00118B254B|nr:hypothetical protein [Crateriforma conspicua]QDV64171.1 hypothetical protein Mal65_33210 [Crateriforma conspicua]
MPDPPAPDSPTPDRDATRVEFSQCVEFNQLLVALSRADLSLRLYPGRYGDAFVDDLRALESDIARSIGLGGELPAVLDDVKVTPPRYAAAFRTWVGKADASVALSAFTQSDPRESLQLHAWYRTGASLAVLLAVACVVFVMAAVFSAPRMDRLFDDLGLDGGDQTGLLWWMAGTVCIAVFVLLAAGFYFGRRVLGGLHDSIANSNLSNFGSSARRQSFASDIAARTAALVSTGWSSDVAVRESIRLSVNRNDPPGAWGSLLQWASRTESSPHSADGADPPTGPTEGSSPAFFQSVSNAYQQLSEFGRPRQSLWPALTHALIGGVLVATAAYFLIGPYVRLLIAVS